MQSIKVHELTPPTCVLFFSKNFDPSEISGVYGEDGQLPSVRSLGFNVKFNF